MKPDVGVIIHWLYGSRAIHQRAAGERFARISLELGGKNALVVCDDAGPGERREMGSALAFA
ncbi:MAG: aldehyde dehydrogenase family protein [Anaerolineales bacterium]